MTDYSSRSERFKRRIVTIPSLFIGTVAITLAAPVWLPIAVLVDTVRLRFRFPVTRLMAFAVGWGWAESLGILRAAWLWATGRSNDIGAHYELMGWWAGLLIRVLGATTGLRPRIEGGDALVGGNAVVLSRHASLGDSLVSGWALRTVSGLQPRYVLKRELLFDPCLDVVGLRIPNHFLHREATDGGAELDAIRNLGEGVGSGIVGVIFPEGTRANDRKRVRALEKISERDPERAARLSDLVRLLPPRPAGSKALLDGTQNADVVLVWHTGFDGLDTFRGMIDKVAQPPAPVRFVARRVCRADVDEDDFGRWLDDQWLTMDAQVDAALNEP